MQPNNLPLLIGAGSFIVLGQIIVAVFGFFKERSREGKLNDVKRKIEAVSIEQTETKHELNSRLTELVEAVRIAARASGILEGKAQQRKVQAGGNAAENDEVNRRMSTELIEVGKSHSKVGLPEDALNPQASQDAQKELHAK